MKNKLFLMLFVVFLSTIMVVSASTLPTVGGDSGNWGTILNNYLLSNHFNYYNSTSLTSLSQLNNDLGLGNWTADKQNYYTNIQTDNQIKKANNSIKEYINNSFVVNSGGDNLTGQYDYNGGWTSNGLSIIDGDLYAQTIYAINFSKLNVTTLSMNGSFYPSIDSQFDLGNSTYKWRDINLGRNAVIGGTATVVGNLIVNIDNLFVNTITGNVGIGTALPKNKLNVIGNGNFTGSLYSNGSSVLTSETDPLAYNGTLAYNSSLVNYYPKSNFYGFYNSTNPQTEIDPIYTAENSTIARIGICPSGQFIQNTTVMGIQCATPSGVIKNGTITGRGIVGYIPKWNGTTYLNNSIIYQNGNNIGIGVNNPTYKLQVAGDINFNNSLYINSSSGNVGINTKIPLQKLEVAGGDVKILASGSIGAAIQLNVTSNGNWSEWQQTGDRTRLNNNHFSDMVTILNTGDMGIGIALPKNKLNVNGDGNFTGNLYLNGAIVSKNNIKSSESNGTTNGGFSFIQDTDTGLFSPSDGVISFYSNAQERMKVDTSGGVTISALAGTGNAYACIDSTGKIYRSATACA